MCRLDDDAHQHAQVLRALGIEPLDLVTLPGGQYVSLITRTRYFIAALDSGHRQVILPCRRATTARLAADRHGDARRSRAASARKCDLTVGPRRPATMFPDWAVRRRAGRRDPDAG